MEGSTPSLKLASFCVMHSPTMKSQPLSPISTVDRIRATAVQLKGAEQRVAQAILSDIDWATRATTRDVARRAGVSEPTVIRFARHVGCSGFVDLKRRVSQDIATARMFIFPDHAVISSDSTVTASQVYEATAQALAYSFAQRAWCRPYTELDTPMRPENYSTDVVIRSSINWAGFGLCVPMVTG